MTTMSFTSRVAANVRAEMARGQITQQSLASRVELSQQAISRRLTGRQPFNTEELQGIAEALGVGIEQLVNSRDVVTTEATVLATATRSPA
ncbi:helix-turn-helix domain-containing protein [Mycobacteroides abscessus]|uniref:helix-turn-helix domain-containing protein n=1 Tax=Mycobacteroides abscessus TaxID=36809 RepID=UPI0009A68EAF|nr:helix-turn-helix transcriptional regulator [Mycobacteroides abscessus]